MTILLLVILAVLLYAAIGLFIDEWLAEDEDDRLGALSALIWPALLASMVACLFDDCIRRLARFARSALSKEEE